MLLLASVVVAAVAIWHGNSIADGIIDGSLTPIVEHIDMQTKVTKWCYKGPGGMPLEYSISTVRNVDETVAEWCARHDAAVEAALITHPPVPCK